MARHMRCRDAAPSRPWGQILAVVVLLAVTLGASIMLARSRQRTQAAEGHGGVSSDASEAVPATEADPSDTEASSVAEAPTTPFLALLEQGDIASIRLVGDSITAGYGTDGYADADLTGEGVVVYDDGRGTVHREASHEALSWANRFRAWAAEHAISDFVNAGVNGAFMKGLADDPGAWLMGGADVVVVALGTNDAGYYGPDEFERDARTALAAASEASRLVVVLSPVADLRPTDTLVESAASLGDILAAICAESGYVFCDTRPYVTSEMFCADGLHPTSEGSLAIFEAISETLGI